MVERFLSDRVKLFIISFASLFLELVFIRWLSTEIRVFAYFKNFPLIASFLGLGIGSIKASDKKWLPRWFLWVLAGLIGLITFAKPLRLTFMFFPDPSITQWRGNILSPDALKALESFGLGQSLLGIFPAPAVLLLLATVFFVIVLAIFYVVVALFVPIGEHLGALMNTELPLKAYSINIAGSLVGILAFSIIAALGTSPLVWLVIGLASLAPFVRPSRTALALAIGAIIVVAVPTMINDAVYWSPYYRVEVIPLDSSPTPHGYEITVNHDQHQYALDLSSKSIEGMTYLQGARIGYDLPYLIAPARDEVLVVGAGTGNDVAAALRSDVRHVDAVEIDPTILKLGKTLHGEKPYQSPLVTAYVNDARAFFQQTNRRYDLIVFGVLDSHTVLSGLSSVRLDSYVYTVESLRSALAHMNEGGIVVLSFATTWKEWQGKRIFNSIKEASGQIPIVIEDASGMVSSFIFGPGVDRIDLGTLAADSRIKVVNQKYSGSSVRPAYDDWPFFYLNPDYLPIAYLLALGVILVSSWTLVNRRIRMAGRAARIDWHMFFLGAAFLLVETKSLAELALLFGSTWIVNSAVFAGVLTMILLANLLVERFPAISVRWAYVFLVLALFVSYLFPVARLNTLELVPRAIVGSLISTLPFFFAAIIFANSFSRVALASVALGSNLLGAVVGGILEASSMAIGIKALNLVAVALYLLSAGFRYHVGPRRAGSSEDRRRDLQLGQA